MNRKKLPEPAQPERDEVLDKAAEELAVIAETPTSEDYVLGGFAVKDEIGIMSDDDDEPYIMVPDDVDETEMYAAADEETDTGDDAEADVAEAQPEIRSDVTEMKISAPESIAPESIAPESIAPESIAPESDTSSVEKNVSERVNRKYGYLIRPTAVLLVVCGIVALLVAVVNYFTSGPIELRAREERDAEMNALFPECDFAEREIDAGSPVTGAYEVIQYGARVGYCILVSPQGFGGEIRAVVGIDASGKIVGVSVISHSETASVGDKALSPSYLSQYSGIVPASDFAETHGGVDAVSGATTTSKAIFSGINAAYTVAVGLATEDLGLGDANVTT